MPALSRAKYVLKIIAALTLLILSSLAAFSQTETVTPTPGVEEIYLAKDDGAGKAGDQATEFQTTDIPIYCVVLLDAAGKTTVKMNFVAVNVAGVKPETKVVTASYTTREGQNRVNFTGRPEAKWTPGRYRVDLFLDGKAARTLEFDIKGSASTPAIAVKYFRSAPSKPKPKPRSGKNP